MRAGARLDHRRRRLSGSHSEEVHGVGRRSLPVALHVAGQRAGDGREAVGWERVRNDEDTMMRLMVREALQREPDEVVPIARHEAPTLCRYARELLCVREPAAAGIMGAE